MVLLDARRLRSRCWVKTRGHGDQQTDEVSTIPELGVERGVASGVRIRWLRYTRSEISLFTYDAADIPAMCHAARPVRYRVHVARCASTALALRGPCADC